MAVLSLLKDLESIKFIDGSCYFSCIFKYRACTTLLFCLYINMFKELFFLASCLFWKADAKVRGFYLTAKCFSIYFLKKVFGGRLVV